MKILLVCLAFLLFSCTEKSRDNEEYYPLPNENKLINNKLNYECISEEELTINLWQIIQSKEPTHKLNLKSRLLRTNRRFS